MKPVRIFEPSEKIDNTEDFVRELKTFCKDEHVNLTIIEKSMEPVVEIDGQQFVCRLKEPDINETENPFQRAFGMIGTINPKEVVALYKKPVSDEA